MKSKKNSLMYSIIALFVFSVIAYSSITTQSNETNTDNFSIEIQALSIIAPGSGYSQEVSADHWLEITFTITGGEWATFYLLKGGTPVVGPSGLEVASGTFDIYLPSSLEPGSDYQAKIEEQGVPSNYDIGDFFTLTNADYNSGGGNGGGLPPGFPPLIPGYDYVIIIGVISLVSTLIIKKMKRRLK